MLQILELITTDLTITIGLWDFIVRSSFRRYHVVNNASEMKCISKMISTIANRILKRTLAN